MSTTATLLAAEEAAHELPIPPWLILVIALLAFAFLLGVTWSFRGTHHKYAPPPAPHDDGAPHADAHWPEHPGHH
ncbi:hypothetical protein [Phycicoccus sonneratiae]|uniref:Uncharacterized protein n=1 Tax=Phycicoccus sonneratiae TaxID=2807628 RepID=A0ABS2CLI6_9MICO|nr:hypothetical protein [Phycicoccus sonneraticus]MBM6400333.1 hypothetical protein [Phycicoccus sonneraticus]